MICRTKITNRWLLSVPSTRCCLCFHKARSFLHGLSNSKKGDERSGKITYLLPGRQKTPVPSQRRLMSLQRQLHLQWYFPPLPSHISRKSRFRRLYHILLRSLRNRCRRAVKRQLNRIWREDCHRTIPSIIQKPSARYKELECQAWSRIIIIRDR